MGTLLGAVDMAREVGGGGDCGDRNRERRDDFGGSRRGGKWFCVNNIIFEVLGSELRWLRGVDGAGGGREIFGIG